MVGLEEFGRTRAEICASSPASDGDNLLGMEIDACAHLGDGAHADEDPDLWRGMRVSSAPAGEWLIVGEATGRASDAPAIAAALSRIWEDRLRYGFRSAHTVVSTPGSVHLLAVTQIALGGFWVTVNVRVSLT